MSNLYGWFGKFDQSAPEHDPPHNAECPYCGEPMVLSDIRTHSFVPQDVSEQVRSYFYRTHRTCDDAASEGQRQSIFGGVCDRVQQDFGVKP